MFQIGETLRLARRSRELELETVARQTMIRPKYLAALEAERFDLLPGEVYARSFLREYADYLGLDPEPFLQELDARVGEGEEEQPVLLYAPPRRRLRPRAALGLLAAAAGVVAVALAAWHSGSPGPARLASPPSARPHPSAQARPAVQTTPSRPAQPRPAHVRLVAAGDCWLSVRSGSDSGQVLYEGLLTGGRSLTFRLRPLWIRIGAPWNLEVRVGGHRLGGLPSNTGNVLVTRSGLRTV